MGEAGPRKPGDYVTGEEAGTLAALAGRGRNARLPRLLHGFRTVPPEAVAVT